MGFASDPAFHDRIRKLLPADAPAVVKIVAETYQVSIVPIGPQWTPQQMADEVHSGFGWGYLSSSGTLEAFILLRDVVQAWEITFLATAPAARGQGHMLQLIRHLKGEAAVGQEPPRSIWLEVHEQNLPAIKMYEKSGFVRSGRRPRYYQDGGAALLYNYG